jgi:hypothetical protein
MTESFQLLTATGDKARDKRSQGLRNVQYYLGRLGEGRSVPLETIQSRQQYLSTLRVQTQDKEVLVWMDRLNNRLKDMSNPEKAKKLSRSFDPRKR